MVKRSCIGRCTKLCSKVDGHTFESLDTYHVRQHSFTDTGGVGQCTKRQTRNKPQVRESPYVICTLNEVYLVLARLFCSIFDGKMFFHFQLDLFRG